MYLYQSNTRLSFCCKFIVVVVFLIVCVCVCVFLQELIKVQAQLEEQGRRLQKKQEQCSQLETSLKDSRDKLLTAEQRIETLETQTKVSVTAAHFCFVIVTFWKCYRPVVIVTDVKLQYWCKIGLELFRNQLLGNNCNVYLIEKYLKATCHCINLIFPYALYYALKFL